MLEVSYYASRQELLIDGLQRDFGNLVFLIRDLFSVSDLKGEIVIPVASAGETLVEAIVIRKDSSPNRVSFDSGQIVFSIAPTLLEQFVSFVDFARLGEFPDSPMGYHRHYEYLGQDECIAPDSLSTVFGLKKREQRWRLIGQ